MNPLKQSTQPQFARTHKLRRRGGKEDVCAQLHESYHKANIYLPNPIGHKKEVIGPNATIRKQELENPKILLREIFMK